MKAALDTAEKENELVFYEDGHGFVHEPNRIDFYTRLEKFLVECTAPGGSASSGA